MHAGNLVRVKGDAESVWKVRSIHRALGNHHQEVALARADQREGRRFMLVPLADVRPYPDCEMTPDPVAAGSEAERRPS